MDEIVSLTGPVETVDGKRRFFAVLHIGPIMGPREAVRAAIVAEQRAKNGWPCFFE